MVQIHEFPAAAGAVVDSTLFGTETPPLHITEKHLASQVKTYVLSGAGPLILPVVDETAMVFKTGTPANTLTFDVNAYTAPRIVTWPNQALTVAGLQVPNIFTAVQKIDVSSTAALVVEDDGVNDSTLVVDTATGSGRVTFGSQQLFRFEDNEKGGALVINPTGGGAPVVIEIKESDSSTPAMKILARTTGGRWDLYKAGVVHIRIGAGTPSFEWNFDRGRVNDAVFRGDTDANLLYIDSGLEALGVGTNVPAAKMHIDQTSATGTKECTLFDQADEDFAILKFVGTSAPGDANMSLVDAADFPTLGALIGAFKVRLTDTTVGGIGTDIEGWSPVYAQLT